jgi:hypothetical protein
VARAIVLTAANTEQASGHIAGGSADNGFTEGPRRLAGLCSKVVGQDRLVVFVAPGHHRARRASPAPPRFAEHGEAPQQRVAPCGRRPFADDDAASQMRHPVPYIRSGRLAETPTDAVGETTHSRMFCVGSDAKTY